MFGFFLDGLKKKDPTLAATIAPHIYEYLSSRASVSRAHVMPESFSGVGGRIPWVKKDNTEQRIDAQEDFFSDPETIKAYADAGMELPDEDAISTLPPDDEQPQPYTIQQRNEEHALAAKEFRVLRHLEKEKRKAQKQELEDDLFEQLFSNATQPPKENPPIDVPEKSPSDSNLNTHEYEQQMSKIEQKFAQDSLLMST